MNVQLKAFQLSFLIHTVLIVAVLALGVFFKNPYHLQVINFDLEPAGGAGVDSSPAKAPTLKKHPAIKTVKKETPVKKASLIRKEIPHPKSPEIPVEELSPEPQPQLTPSPSELAVPVFPLPFKTQLIEKGPGSLRPGAGGSNGAEGFSSGPIEGTSSGIMVRRGRGSGGPVDKGQIRYLREQFAYIRDKILGNIHYPARARRLGWQGKVLLSFIIALDGSIKEARIIRGSGFELLDQNALATVKDTAPFPKPPAEAKLIIPIIYRLE
jgi:periplasmic protein TonB